MFINNFVADVGGETERQFNLIAFIVAALHSVSSNKCSTSYMHEKFLTLPAEVLMTKRFQLLDLYFLAFIKD
jgi:hypothetical protein